MAWQDKGGCGRLCHFARLIELLRCTYRGARYAADCGYESASRDRVVLSIAVRTSNPMAGLEFVLIGVAILDPIDSVFRGVERQWVTHLRNSRHGYHRHCPLKGRGFPRKAWDALGPIQSDAERDSQDTKRQLRRQEGALH